jgi:hypothetical protein
MFALCRGESTHGCHQELRRPIAVTHRFRTGLYNSYISPSYAHPGLPISKLVMANQWSLVGSLRLGRRCFWLRF